MDAPAAAAWLQILAGLEHNLGARKFLLDLFHQLGADILDQAQKAQLFQAKEIIRQIGQAIVVEGHAAQVLVLAKVSIAYDACPTHSTVWSSVGTFLYCKIMVLRLAMGQTTNSGICAGA